MAQEHNEKRLGRPPKEATPGKRVSLGLKVTPEIKQRIDEEARRTGRTQSQQAELMIERSFAQEEAFGVAGLRQLAILMASAFWSAGRLRAAGKEQWIDDPDCYRAGLRGVLEALLIGLPGGTLKEMLLELEGAAGTIQSHFARKEQQT
jgi:predicted transcriptional regulator